MSDTRNYKDKYYRLKDKYEIISKVNVPAVYAIQLESKAQRDDLKHSLDSVKHKVRRLKEENNQLLDIMMDMNPQLADDLSNSSTDEEMLSGMSTDDESMRTVLTKYGSQSKTISRSNVKTGALTTKRRRTSPQANMKHPGKRKVDDESIPDEPQQKRRRSRAPGVKKKRDDRTDAKRVEPLPMNPDGTLRLPVTIGKGTNEVTIYKIGNIVWDREAYHTNRYIFPVGFMSKKQYLSAVDVTKRTTYTSEILDGGDTPIFQVTAADQPGRKFSASSSSGVWKKILDEINCQGVPSKTHASGPEMLGLSHLGITKYIQELPGAEKCTKYVMQRWLDDDQPGKQADLSVKAESTDGDKGSVTNGHDHD